MKSATGMSIARIFSGAPHSEKRQSASKPVERFAIASTTFWRGTMPTARELLPTGAVRPERIIQPGAAPGLDYASTAVGTVGQITVEYATSLGQAGHALAQNLLGVVEPPYIEMESQFGVTGGAVTVVVAPLSGHNDGSGGAYHYGCDFSSGGVLYLDATFANTTVDPTNLELSLYIAELSEAFMG